MNILGKLSHKLVAENYQDCRMFWIYPIPNEKDIKWETFVTSNPTSGEDLSNWLIILHKLKLAWKKDFSQCKEAFQALPRGVIVDNFLYHGNNNPRNCPLSEIAKSHGGSLGKELTPIYKKDYGINKQHLEALESAIGQELGLIYTE
jgi:hypothetical protein